MSHRRGNTGLPPEAHGNTASSCVTCVKFQQGFRAHTRRLLRPAARPSAAAQPRAVWPLSCAFPAEREGHGGSVRCLVSARKPVRPHGLTEGGAHLGQDVPRGGARELPARRCDVGNSVPLLKKVGSVPPGRGGGDPRPSCPSAHRRADAGPGGLALAESRKDPELRQVRRTARGVRTRRPAAGPRSLPRGAGQGRLLRSGKRVCAGSWTVAGPGVSCWASRGANSVGRQGCSLRRGYVLVAVTGGR